MSDIITTASSKIIQPSEPIQSVQPKTTPSLPQQQGGLSDAGSTDPIPLEQLKQIEQDLAHLHGPKQVQQQSEQLKKYAATLKEFSEKDLQRLQQRIASLSPKQLEDLIHQLQKHLSQLQATLTELKKQKKVDPEKADLILDVIDIFSSKDLQNLSKEDRQKLSNTLDILKEQATKLIQNKQVEPEVGNVLVLFLAFAKMQMDQNDKAMLAGIQQTRVKTTQLELQEEKQKDFASRSTQGKHISNAKMCMWGAIGIILGMVAFFTLGATFAVAVPIGLTILGSFIATWTVADNNPNAPGLEGIMDTGPDGNLMTEIQSLLAYCNTQTQKLSSQLSSTEKMFVENVSDRSTQLGQQAGQAITDMGKIMEPR
ncbi:MAG: hypothetical protein LBC45_02465 [Chlamydiales bacterium]|jgi:uncharacterized membrane protein YqjE|nr:hypothetical protein [Chlamydiales bacterium]